MFTYSFDDFSYVDKPIIIPEGAVFFRGIPNGKNIVNLNVLRDSIPIYLGSKSVAKLYSTNINDKFYSLQLKKDIKLIDIRKVISILPFLLNTFDASDSNNNHIATVLKVVLGLTNIDEQIVLLNNMSGIPEDRKQNLINFAKEKRLFNLGVRVPITNLDAEMVLLLKKIFSSYYDGIIAPQLYSPFEYNDYTHEEIIKFDTKNLEIINEINTEKIIEFNIISILDKNLLKTYFNANPLYVGGKKLKYIDKNKAFENNKFVSKTQKLIEKSFKNITINPELWNNSSHIFRKHLDNAYFLH
jgi:hypothetical protein